MNPTTGLVCVVLAIASPYFLFWIYVVHKRYKKNYKYLSELSKSAGPTSELDIENNRQKAREAAVDGIELET